jgi:hypothetical protein
MGGKVPGAKEVSRLTPKGSAELTEGPQGGVLDGLLESGQGGAADLQSPGHLDLGQTGVVSKPPEGVRQEARKIHARDSCAG